MRQKYKNVKLEDATDFDYIQLKYDGIWGRLEVVDGVATLISRTGKEKPAPDVTLPDGIYIGEYMFGSQWGKEHNIDRKFYCFDVLDFRGLDLSNEPFVARDRVRKRISDQKNFLVVRTFGGKHLPDLTAAMKDFDFEGLVFRNSGDMWGDTVYRYKRQLTVDCVIEGFEEGKGKHAGKLGAIIARISEAGFEHAPRVLIGGGFSDALRAEIWRSQPTYLGRTIEVSAQKVFKSGSLRHPNFVRFHLDK